MTTIELSMFVLLPFENNVLLNRRCGTLFPRYLHQHIYLFTLLYYAPDLLLLKVFLYVHSNCFQDNWISARAFTSLGTVLKHGGFFFLCSSQDINPLRESNHSKEIAATLVIVQITGNSRKEVNLNKIV